MQIDQDAVRSHQAHSSPAACMPCLHYWSLASVSTATGMPIMPPGQHRQQASWQQLAVDWQHRWEGMRCNPAAKCSLVGRGWTRQIFPTPQHTANQDCFCSLGQRSGAIRLAHHCSLSTTEKVRQPANTRLYASIHSCGASLASRPGDSPDQVRGRTPKSRGSLPGLSRIGHIEPFCCSSPGWEPEFWMLV